MYTQIVIKIFYVFSLQYIRMSGKNISFNNNEIQKSYFYKNKKVYDIEDIDAS